eukprot:TRINITY_DN15557_c0_g1_i1.p1 TRINITY_DN15557_c0_g1~~TRINITY_DN15557_c0_g1_i1.p1  ORF type:complete len:470 (+),score=55.14 TRINITY_DN15557_c0_g1_i1:263-1672(+)
MLVRFCNQVPLPSGWSGCAGADAPCLAQPDGTCIMWSFEYSLAVPFFTSNLHMSEEVANLSWIGGPISGLIIGPCVGSLSDRSQSRFGKRRPFILVGLVCTAASAMLFASCELLLGPGSQGAAILAFCMLWAMDLAINTVQTPMRALLSDISCEEDQVLAQSVSATFAGGGQCLGYLLTSVIQQPLDHMIFVYAVGLSCLFSTAVVTLCFVSEKAPSSEAPPAAQTAAAGNGKGSLCGDILASLQKLSPPQKMLCFVQFFTWAAWFCHQQIVTQLFGQVVFGGDNDAPHHSAAYKRYQDGLQAGSVALTWQQVVSLSSAVVFGALQARLPVAAMYGCALLIVSVCFMSEYLCCLLDEPPVAMVQTAVAVSGIGYGATQVFPYSIMGLLVPDPAAKGMAMGTLSICIVTPQMLDMAYLGVVADALNLSYVVLLGSCYAFIAGSFAFCVTIPRRCDESPEMSDFAAVSDGG